jgi:RNA-directed DNA polymerase
MDEKLDDERNSRREPITPTKGRSRAYRYADDFSSTGETKGLLEGEAKPLVEPFMRERGLELSCEKTVITPIENGFDFLGQHVRN